MIVVFLSTLIGYCHPLGCGGSGKEGNGVMVLVEWEREIIDKGRVERRIA